MEAAFASLGRRSSVSALPDLASKLAFRTGREGENADAETRRFAATGPLKQARSAMERIKPALTSGDTPERRTACPVVSGSPANLSNIAAMERSTDPKSATPETNAQYLTNAVAIALRFPPNAETEWSMGQMRSATTGREEAVSTIVAASIVAETESRLMERFATMAS